MTALVMAITVDRILNGLTRPFWGWVSDHIGRENAIFIAFILEAVAVFALLQLISRPVWFIALSGLCFFAWGNIFSLFPSITGDLYGNKWATTNYGIVYTAKGVAAVLPGPAPLGCLPRPVPGQGLLGDDCLRSDRRVHGFAVAEASGTHRTSRNRERGLRGPR